MADLIVEDGTIVANADSYISRANADSYFTNHGSPTDWTGATDANKDSALRYATVFLDSMYTWRGTIADESQVLRWPRAGVVDDEGRDIDDDTIPQKIKDAQCELGLLHLASVLNEAFDRGGAVAREKVGSVEIEYFDRAQAERYMPYIQRIVKGFYKGSISGVTMERA